MTDSDPLDFSDATPLLVGREPEQARLRDLLRAARANRGGLVLIGGEAGIGKTSLAEALCRDAERDGVVTLVGRCYDLTETPPYGPWIDLFARYQPASDSPPLPEAFRQRGTVGAVASQAVLFTQVEDFLVALATSRPEDTRPVLVLLDDLHWADPASLDLLRFLARSLATMPLLVLITYRADELTRRHPLYQLLPVLVREASAIRIDLQPIEESDMRALVVARHHLPTRDTERLVTYLHARSEGNLFFLSELLRTLEVERVLRRTGDGWTIGDLTQVRVPLLLRQVVDGRLARLDDEAQRLLAFGAVIGQELPLTLWASVASVDEEALVAVVEQATAARMLEASPDSSGVRFVHALIREALYEGIVPVRRRAWHRQVGEYLAAHTRADPDAVAHHFRQAEDGRATDWLILAGERARDAYAWVTAIERFERALAMIDGGVTDAGRRSLLLYRLARLRRYDDPRRAIADLDDVARIAAADGDHALVALALFCRGMSRSNMRDTIKGLSDLVAGVEGLRTLSDEEMARLEYYEGGRRAWPNAYGTLVQALASVGQFAEALTVAERGALDEPSISETGKGSFLSDLHFGLGLAHAAMGRPEEAHRAFAHARAIYRAVEHHLLVGRTAVWELLLVSLIYRADHLPERQQLAVEGEEGLRRASGVLAAQFSPRLASLPLMLVEGAWEEARSLAQAARADQGVFNGEFVTALLGQLAREQGNPRLAWGQIADLLPDGPATEPTWQPFHYAQMSQRVAAALALDARDTAVARAWLEAHDRWLAWSGAVLGQAEGQIVWAQYHRAVGDSKRADHHARQALVHAGNPRQPLALLAAHRLLGELDTDAGRHADAAMHLATSLELADACAAPYERALTLLALAALRIATHTRAEANTLIEEVRAICTPLDARPALARADALAAEVSAQTKPVAAYPAGLSAREAEVLRLVAEGLTNAQVAERLFLSPHTINSHLTAIYSKLGVPSRSAAIRFAVEHNLR